MDGCIILSAGAWFHASPRDPRVIGLYNRHYSAERGRREGRLRGGVGGNGERLVLLTGDGRALFCWLAAAYRMDGQEGVNCAVFRNEGPRRSSDLIREACALAWQRWPAARLWTYVDVAKTAARRSRRHSPGHCFQMAGWTLLPQLSGRRLRILEVRSGADGRQ